MKFLTNLFGGKYEKKASDQKLRGNNSPIELAVENIQERLEPVLLKILKEAPDWGTIGLTISFNNGTIKRIETSSNQSILWKDGE
jgi:hypothetical protein